MNAPTAPAGLALDEEPGLHQHVWILWVRKGSILAVLAVVVGAMLLDLSRQPKTYMSSTDLLVQPLAKRPGGVEVYETFTNMEPVRRVAASAEVERRAEERLGAMHESATMSVQTPNVQGSNTLIFLATAPSARAAQRTAETYADVFLGYRLEGLLDDVKEAGAPIEARIGELSREIEQTQYMLALAAEPQRSLLGARHNLLLGQRQALEQERNDLRVPGIREVGRVLRPAELPDSPISPRRFKTLVMALFFGSVLGVGQAVVRSQFAPRVQGRKDLTAEFEATAAVLVAKERRNQRGLVTVTAPGSKSAEAYVTLSATVISEMQRRGTRSVLITSSGAGEGTALTTANLGVSLTQAGKLVVIVPAGLDRPRLPAYFPRRNGPGLPDVLSSNGHAPESSAGGLEYLTGTVVDRLRVLDGAAAELPPADLFTPGAMRMVLDELERETDLVLIEAPPVLGGFNTLAVAAIADAVLIVAAADRTTCAALRETRLRLELAATRVIGAVLHDVERARLVFEERFDRGTALRSEDHHHPPGVTMQDDWPLQV